MAIELSDDELLVSIAQERSQEAFAELHRRYAHLCFNVALNTTGNRSLAEEALQEALLQIWLSAGSYQPGNARGWILRIVAHESLDLVQTQQKGKKRMEAEISRNESSGSAGIAEHAEHGELLNALRRVLHDLPARDRQLVALHFGAGLTQQEISAALVMPQQTISFKIKKVLDDLRGRLAVAGFAATAPLLSAEWMSEAICSGVPEPQGVGVQVLSKLASKSRAMRSAPKLAKAAKVAGISKGLLVGGAVLMAGALATAAWFATAKSAPQTPAVLVPIVPAKDEISQRWSFDDGIPTDLSPADAATRSKWQWKKTEVGGELVSPVPVVLNLPITAPKQPFAITAHFDIQESPHNVFSGACWRADHKAVPMHEWSMTKDYTKKERPKTVVHTVYFFDRTIVDIVDGSLSKVSQAEQPYPTDKVSLIFMKCGLLDLEYHTLSEAERATLDAKKLIDQAVAGGYDQADIPALELRSDWLDEKKSK